MDRYFVYMLASKRNGTLYVGVTSDLNRRVAAYRAKAVPGFTRTYGVDKLVLVEGYSSIDEARDRERRLKRWKREWKLELIEKRIQHGAIWPMRSKLTLRVIYPGSRIGARWRSLVRDTR